MSTNLKAHLITEHTIDGTAKDLESRQAREALHESDHNRMESGEDMPFVTDHPRDSRHFVQAVADRAIRKARS